MTDTYKPGDTVVLTRDVERVIVEIVDEGIDFAAHRLGSGVVTRMVNELGWSVESHTPAVTLPNEPDVYRDSNDDLWEYVQPEQANADGMRWWDCEHARYVIDWFDGAGSGYTQDLVRRARQHFGVEER